MKKQMSRRAWLTSTAAWTAAGWTCRMSRGIEPIERTGVAKFKFSLAGYSYRTLLQGNPPKLTLHDFVRDCAAFGLEGTELTSYYFPDPVTPEYLYDLRRLCFRLGLDVSGTAVRNDFGLPPGPERDRWINHVKQWVDYSVMLGAPVIRIFAGNVPRGSSAQEAHRRMVEGFEECCDYAGKHGVHLALENHGGPTATVEGLLALVRDVKSPWFGVNLDTGNFRSDDIYGDLAKAAPYAINVQVKVVITGPDGKKQPADFRRLAEILRHAGYRGYIVLEYEEAGDPRTECPRYLDQIREAFL
ncbi:MAG: xylose isomerase [Pirellulaceae bacterium]|nr:MAG: xylose isomerase [Pirellulaceae bacterium]